MEKSKWNPKSWFKRGPNVSMIRLYGAIGAGGRFSQTISHAPLEKAIDAAFASKRTKAVALIINSPGGSPSQSGLIARHIRRLADEKDIPVLAFCEDVAASGGYLLACAADEIFVDEYTVIGSIGVISASFGAVEAIDKIGIERRVHTAGKSKSLMDPFREEKPEDVARLDTILHAIHERFIAWVKGSRGAKLKDDMDYFQGDVWVGQGAVDVGIADGVGHASAVLKERFGEDVTIREVSPKKPGLLSRLMGRANAGLTPLAADSASISGVASAAGAGAAQAAVETLEDRALWARYGI
jgi:serine protease SohB